MIKLKHAALAAIQILMLQAGVALAAEEPLPPDQAFKLKVSLRDPNTVTAEFTPAKGHYLYKNKTFFALKNSSGALIREVRLPPGEVKNDPFFGTMETYKKPIQVEIVLDRTPKAKRLTLLANYQGCNEKIGVCYPPQQKSFDLAFP
ncbi:MAG: protein-disulfide reductase DsbD N-terminal domain-containing protein [Gammaproteobacteria bacterium]|nr:protein-disulfide reductase DsbD N-terminal domain-containing protein [Gammaproteobacteria bacterium]